MFMQQDMYCLIWKGSSHEGLLNVAELSWGCIAVTLAKLDRIGPLSHVYWEWYLDSSCPLWVRWPLVKVIFYLKYSKTLQVVSAFTFWRFCIHLRNKFQRGWLKKAWVFWAIHLERVQNLCLISGLMLGCSYNVIQGLGCPPHPSRLMPSMSGIILQRLFWYVCVLTTRNFFHFSQWNCTIVPLGLGQFWA